MAPHHRYKLKSPCRNVHGGLAVQFSCPQPPVTNLFMSARTGEENGSSGVSMTDASTDTETYLEFGCPRCGRATRDEYETLDAMVPTDWRCGGCGRVFNVVLLDCQLCATETVSVALIAAEQSTRQYLVCSKCNRPALDHEAVEDDIF